MTFLVILGNFGCFMAGGALIWFFKEPIKRWSSAPTRFRGSFTQRLMRSPLRPSART
jgi:hypothetical protein